MGWAKFNEDIQSRIEERWVLRENIGAVVTMKSGESEEISVAKNRIHDEFYRSVMY